LHLYAGDSKQFFPAIARPPFYWADWHPALINGGYLPFSEPRLKFGNVVASFSGGAYCPAMLQRDAPCFQRQVDAVSGNTFWFLSHFGLNVIAWDGRAVPRPDGWATPLRHEAVKRPSLTILIGESYSQNYIQGQLPPLNGAMSFSHGGGSVANYGAFDGHMSTLRINDPELLVPWSAGHEFWNGGL
jgi:hypothetical protein